LIKIDIMPCFCKFTTLLYGLVLLALNQSCAPNRSAIHFVYPNGNTKALIMSYDDGLVQDIKLVGLFNENGITGTFNLNSGLFGQTNIWKRNNAPDIIATYVSKDSLLYIYKHHEIAAHGATHLNFTNASDSAIYQDVMADIKELKNLTNITVVSMAYPFGSSNEHIAGIVKSTGITNARTIASTYTFDLPKDYWLWHPTCHDSKGLQLVNDYLSLKSNELSVFHVWGHSWEFDDTNRWNDMTNFCRKIGNRKDIWYTGAGEFTAYQLALKGLVFRQDSIINPSPNQTIWYRQQNTLFALSPGQAIPDPGKSSKKMKFEP
jgi:peptidoglycan/xylan/chitin deacetylase (PgdA/CDA1 family)